MYVRDTCHMYKQQLQQCLTQRSLYIWHAALTCCGSYQRSPNPMMLQSAVPPFT